jgi:hypothetical protein
MSTDLDAIASLHSASTLSRDNEACGAIHGPVLCTAQAGVAPASKSRWQYNACAGEK